MHLQLPPSSLVGAPDKVSAGSRPYYFYPFIYMAKFCSGATRMSRTTFWKIPEAAYTRIKSAKLALMLAGGLQKKTIRGTWGGLSRGRPCGWATPPEHVHVKWNRNPGLSIPLRGSDTLCNQVEWHTGQQRTCQNRNRSRSLSVEVVRSNVRSQRL